MNGPGNGNELREKESTSQIFQNVSSLAKGHGQETWYPTLQKTVWVLAQLRDFVKVHIHDFLYVLYSLASLTKIYFSSLPYSKILLKRHFHIAAFL